MTCLLHIAETLATRGTKVRFGIHQVTNRIPTQMNVWLAGVSYDVVLEMDEIKEGINNTDVTSVLGANGTVNNAATEDPNSQNMLVVRVWSQKTLLL